MDESFWILIGLIIQFSNGLSASLLTAQYNIILAARSVKSSLHLHICRHLSKCIRFTFMNIHKITVFEMLEEISNVISAPKHLHQTKLQVRLIVPNFHQQLIQCCPLIRAVQTNGLHFNLVLLAMQKLPSSLLTLFVGSKPAYAKTQTRTTTLVPRLYLHAYEEILNVNSMKS